MLIYQNCLQSLWVRKAGFHPSGAAPLGTPGLLPLPSQSLKFLQPVGRQLQRLIFLAETKPYLLLPALGYAIEA